MTAIPTLPGTGALHRLVMEHDWSATALGAIDTWPPALRTAVGMVLACQLPMYLAWGPEQLLIYNDAYVPILGTRHPAALGAPTREVWREIWDTVGPMWDDVMRGTPVACDDFPFTIDRFGYPETRYFNFSDSPVYGEDGRPVAVLGTFIDTTERVLAEQRARFQLELSDGLRGLHAPDEVTAWTCELLGRFLEARRVGYALVDGDAVDVQLRGWIEDGVESILGQRFPADRFGSEVVRELRAGRTVEIHDAEADPRVRDCSFYQDLRTPAALIVPVLRDGAWIALVYVGAAQPRRWSAADARLVEDAAERTRAAVERALAEESQRRADAAHRFILDRTLAAVVVHDASGAITFCNPMACRLLGLSAAQLQGRVPTDPGWHFLRETGEPMSIEDYPVSIVARTREPLHDYVAGIVHREGAAPVWVLVNAFPELGPEGLPVRIVASFVDVTRRMQAESALRLSEHRSALALEVAGVGTWVLDTRSGEVTVDDRGRSICGLEEGPLTLDAVMARLHPQDASRVRGALQAALDGGPESTYNEEFRWLHPDRGVVWTLSRGRVIDEGDGSAAAPSIMIGSVLDVTERRHLLETLRQTDRRKDEFLAMLAHELRNPLAPISTAAQLLRLAADDPQRVREAAHIIGRQVGHMTEMVDDLLDVSRVTRGLVELERAPVDLRAVLAQAIEQVEPLLQARDHRLVTDTASGGAMVVGDRLRLVQVVANLLNNAAKYTPPGGRIDLSLRTDADQVEIEVSDNGIGMDEALIPRVFDLFTQADRTPDRAQGGLGIGLALVRSVVQLHGGRIDARSAGPGLGSTFTVVLPLNPAPAGGQHNAPSEPAPAAPSLSRRVLVVDDNTDAADTLVAVLNMLGHEAASASCGHDALRVLAQSRDWDAFIVDIGMPDMTGYELVDLLRRAMGDRPAHYIALTGYGQAQDRDRSDAAGFDHHLVKPADIERVQVLLAGVPRGPSAIRA